MERNQVELNLPRQTDSIRTACELTRNVEGVRSVGIVSRHEVRVQFNPKKTTVATLRKVITGITSRKR